MHLLLRWSPNYGKDTVDKHRAVAEQRGSVWWGKREGPKGRRAMSEEKLTRLRHQLKQGIRTHVYLYSSGTTWRTSLQEITEDRDETDESLIPEYYGQETHHLWVRLSDFERIESEWLFENVTLWEGNSNLRTAFEGTTNLMHVQEKWEEEPSSPFGLDSIRAAAAERGLRLSDEIYANTFSAIEGGKHLIFTGPPGTGKTTLAEAVGEAAKQAGRCDGYVLTTATADWTTYETIGGLRPSRNGGLVFEEGHFLDSIRSQQWLIIDELNRSNIDRAFGQLFTVLSGQAVVLPYQREGAEVRLALVPEAAKSPPEGFEALMIPKQWRVLATINVFDKSLLFELSYALMRRFAFIEVPSPPRAVFDELIDNAVGDDEESGVLAKRFLDLRELKDLGPALFIDLGRYLKARSPITNASRGQIAFEAFYSYLLPQFEGIGSIKGEGLYKKLAPLVGPGQRERLIRTLNDVLGLELATQQEEAEEDDDWDDNAGYMDHSNKESHTNKESHNNTIEAIS